MSLSTPQDARSPELKNERQEPAPVTLAPEGMGGAQGVGHPTPSPDPKTQTTATPFDAMASLSAADEAAYHWDIGSGTMVWSANVSQVIQITDLSVITKAAAFAMLIDSDHADRRYKAIVGSDQSDAGEGVGFRVQYRLQPEGRRRSAALWIEEHGRWFAGPSGKPERACGVLRMIDDRHEEEERLHFLVSHDDLTGQMNRSRLTQELDALLMSFEASRSTGAFLMASVNNLTHINKAYGIKIGDEVISIVGRRLQACLRERDHIGRYSANKFGIILSGCSSDELATIASRLLKAVQGSIIETSAGALSTSICLGAALLPQQADTVQQAVLCSLEALDWARAKHSSGFAVFQPSQDRETQRQRNMAIADDVLRALDEGRMCLSLQPIVAMSDHKPAFHECLLGIRKPDGTIVSAGDFVPVAEQLGLVHLLDRRALELAIAYLKSTPEAIISLNVSAQTTANLDWLNALCKMTAGQREINKRLIIEITETTALHQIDESIHFVEGLKHLGCRVAIDDFGAGYSTFKNLRLLDFDIVKIDGSFVKNIAESPADQVFVRMLVELADVFGMETVAEWVGDDATVAILEKAGVTYMQGYLFGAPVLIQANDEAPQPAQAG